MPIYTQDWGTQLFNPNTGEELYPEAIELIRDHARIYSENNYLSGDASYLADDPDLIKQIYLGMTNFGYGSAPEDSLLGFDVVHHEAHFYHSTDPSSLVAWRTEIGVELHWTWDHRFIAPVSLEGPDSIDPVSQYHVIRLINGQEDQSFVVQEGENFFEDENADAGTTYSYRVVSVKDGVEYDYTPENMAVEVGPAVESRLHFWREKRNFQEYALKANATTFDWEIAFGVDGDPQDAEITLEIWKKYDFPTNIGTEDYYVCPNDPTYENGSIVFPLSVSRGYFKSHGGLVFRLKCEQDGQVYYYPEEVDEGAEFPRKHFYWSTINNRVMTTDWNNYKMRIEGPGQEWRAKFVELANAYGSGFIHPDTGVFVSYEGIFVDSVLNEFFVNVIRPCEYMGAASYSSAASDFLLGAASSVIDVKLYPNTRALDLMEDVEGIPGIGGVMFENWVTMFDLNVLVSPFIVKRLHHDTQLSVDIVYAVGSTKCPRSNLVC